jgi:hypothetical protein
LAFGRAPTFCQFDYIHVTLTDGFSFVFQKGDDLVFHQLAVSRGPGGTNASMLFGTNKAIYFNWVGNIYHNINMGVSDGAPIVLNVSDDGCVGNSITYNGVDFAPTILLQGGSVLSDNRWVFLGKPDYVGGFANRPTQNLQALPNVVDTDPLILDWYQEGTVTPTLTIGGSTTGITYTTRLMSFTRIGNLVTVRAQIILSSKGGLTGDVTIGGLPFTAAAGSGASAGISVGYYAGLTALTTAPLGAVAQGTTSVLLYKQGAVSGVALGGADITNTFRIEFSVTYQAAE